MMTESKLALLKAEGQQHSSTARAILAKAKAEGDRPLTEEEQTSFDAAMKAGEKSLEAINRGKHDLHTLEMSKGLAADMTGVGMPGGAAHDLKGKRLSFKGMAGGIAKQMVGEYGQKALAPSGAAVVAQEMTPDPIALGKVAAGLLDVLPVIAHSSAEYAFLRQSTRTNAAAVVAEGAVKPTSAYGLTRVEQSLAVVAHLSEGVPRFWFIDTPTLERFVEAELQYGLGRAVEAKVIADVAATSGIQSQAYATSVLTTLRKGITKLETAGYSPSSIVLHPSDFEGVELALSTVTAVEHLSLPFDAVARRLWGVPIVSTVAQTAGVGHVLALDAVAIDTDEQGVQVTWSENSNADDFSKNLIRARCEGRFNTSVYSPLGVVTADLTP